MISAEEKRILRATRRWCYRGCSSLSYRAENDEGMKIRDATAGMLCFVGLTTGACVMPSAYNGAVADLYAVKSELDRTKTQSQELAEQVRELEEHKVVLSRQMEATSSALHDAMQQMDAERHVLQERFSKLNRFVSQLTAQQHSLRQALRRAKEDQVPLQASVDRYKPTLGEADQLRASLFPPLNAVADATAKTSLPPPAPASVTQDPVPSPAAMAPAASSDPAAATPKAQPVGKQSSGPVEEGWLSTLKGWVVSIWQSIFF